MKRLLVLAAMFLGCMATTFAQFSGSGSGTESDPYLILNPIQLNQMRNFLNIDNVYFRLMSDIDLTEFIMDEYPSQGWLPVGISSTPFKGKLDGNGKTISGLWINRPSSDNIGFFGILRGTVKELTLEGNAINGKDYVGLLSGNCDGASISNCVFSGNVWGSSYVGGCAGYGGTFDKVISSVNVNGKEYVGGISSGKAIFTNCIVECDYVKGNNYVGGICGLNSYNHRMNFCSSYTTVFGKNYVGGLCGKVGNNYSDCTNQFNNCTFIGDISADSYVGGICGDYHGGGSMIRCFALGHITATGNYVGGIIGSSTYYYDGRSLLSR